MSALIVDDSSVDRQKLAEVLTAIDYDFAFATDGSDAVRQALANPPEIIFMDIVMPVLDGIAAARELARHPQTKDIPVVFVTAKTSKRDRLWGKLLGSQHYIGKPFETQQIVEQVNIALARQPAAVAGQ